MAGQLNFGSPFSYVLGLLVFYWCFHCLAVLFDVSSHGSTLPFLNRTHYERSCVFCQNPHPVEKNGDDDISL